jgi:glycosyltransferase involved in cell wall biosynthesis
MILDTERYKPLDDDNFGDELCRELDCDHLIFMPTRHHWKTKGNESALRGLSKLLEDGQRNVKIVLTTFGPDVERSRNLIRELGLEDNVVFVGAMSKPLLRKYLACADVVMDQFSTGEYGTALLEAMAMGRPVCSFFRYEHPVPILNAKTPDEIAKQLAYALDNSEGAKAIGLEGRQWVEQHHGPAAVIPKFEEVLHAVLNNQRIPKFDSLMQSVK